MNGKQFVFVDLIHLCRYSIAWIAERFRSPREIHFCDVSRLDLRSHWLGIPRLSSSCGAFPNSEGLLSACCRPPEAGRVRRLFKALIKLLLSQTFRNIGICPRLTIELTGVQVFVSISSGCRDGTSSQLHDKYAKIISWVKITVRNYNTHAS